MTYNTHNRRNTHIHWYMLYTWFDCYFALLCNARTYISIHAQRSLSPLLPFLPQVYFGHTKKNIVKCGGEIRKKRKEMVHSKRLYCCIETFLLLKKKEEKNIWYCYFLLWTQENGGRFVMLFDFIFALRHVFFAYHYIFSCTCTNFFLFQSVICIAQTHIITSIGQWYLFIIARTVQFHYVWFCLIFLYRMRSKPFVRFF